jgi:sugar/nucleoside kinase (ribokinase family)
MTKVLVIGDLAVDISAHTSDRIVAGRNTLIENSRTITAGVGGNIAWYLKQLGVEPHVAATVGADSWGTLLKQQLSEAKIGTELVRTSSKMPTAFFLVLVDSRGERTMIGSRSANTELKIASQEIVRISPQWIHISGYSLLNQGCAETMKAVRHASEELAVPFSTDLEGVSAEGKHVDLKGAIVFCNVKEFRDYFEASYRKLVKKIRQTAIVKAGPKGCYLLAEKRLLHFPSVAKTVVDTTAAGDAFNAGFISSVLNGNDKTAACRHANAVAALKIQQMGAKVVLPQKELASLEARL